MTEKQAANAAERWPVVHEQSLLRPERRLWRRYRSPDTLPMLQPGCVYVFGVGNEQFAFPRGAELSGEEQKVVDAHSVSIVSTRFRRLWVWARVPTTEPAVDLDVGVSFGCIVDKAERVARAGLTDLAGELRSRIRVEPTLIEHSHQHTPDAIAVAEKAIREGLEAAFRERTPVVAGMWIEFDGVIVRLPDELRRHQREMRDAQWERNRLHVRHQTEREHVQQTRSDLLASAELAEATAVARKERTADQAATRQFEARDTEIERLIAQVKDWLDADGTKRAPVDRRPIVEALFTKLIGTPEERSASAPVTNIVESPPPPAATNGTSREDVTSHVATEDLPV